MIRVENFSEMRFVHGGYWPICWYSTFPMRDTEYRYIVIPVVFAGRLRRTIRHPRSSLIIGASNDVQDGKKKLLMG